MEGWRLDKLEIKYNGYGKDKGEYTGEISFQNKNYERFHFKINSQDTDKYLKLILNEVIDTGDRLGRELAFTMSGGNSKYASINNIPTVEEKGILSRLLGKIKGQK